MKFLLLLFSLFPVFSHAQNTLVILGDSLTEGYGIAKESTFSQLLEKEMPGWKVVNAGISGSTSASGPKRVEWILKAKPRAVLVALGGNDGLRGLDTASMKKNLALTIQAAKKSGAKVLLAGILAPPNYGKEYTSRFAAVFPSLAKEEKIPLYPFLLEGVAGDSKLNLPDGIHPNEKGHKEMAARLLPFLKAELP